MDHAHWKNNPTNKGWSTCASSPEIEFWALWWNVSVLINEPTLLLKKKKKTKKKQCCYNLPLPHVWAKSLQHSQWHQHFLSSNHFPRLWNKKKKLLGYLGIKNPQENCKVLELNFDRCLIIQSNKIIISYRLWGGITVGHCSIPRFL